MKTMKKFIIALLSFTIITILYGCSNNQSNNIDSDKIKIVTTIFPPYDWAREVLGERVGNVEITFLLDNLVDLHSYQPTVRDIARIKNADLFIYVGGESDGWVDNVLRNVANKNMIAINLLDVDGIAVREDAEIEGAENVHAHGHEHDDHDHDHASCDHDHDSWWRRVLGVFIPSLRHHHHHHHHHDERDEHVWLSLANAQVFVNAIANALATLDNENEELYKNNAAAYIEKLSALDNEYRAAIDSANVKTLLFADRFPFRYLAEDYGLNYYAAFAGCFAETEASFETIVFLARKIDELELRNVFVTESADQSIARTVIANTRDKNQQILALNSMQSITSNDVANGATYLQIMQNNLDVLKNALQ